MPSSEFLICGLLFVIYSRIPFGFQIPGFGSAKADRLACRQVGFICFLLFAVWFFPAPTPATCNL
jgi:hypothetical protein